MLLVVLFALFALFGSSRGEYFVPQGVFGYYVGGGYQGPDVAARGGPVPVAGNSGDVSSGDLAKIIERVNQSLRRMKTVSEEAHKAQEEMEELMKILLETAGKVQEEDSKDVESTDSSNEVVATEDTSIDRTTGAESLPTEAGTTGVEATKETSIDRTTGAESLPTEAGTTEVEATEDTSNDRTTGAESLPTEAGTTEQDLPTPIHRTSAEGPLPTESQPDITTAEDDLPDADVTATEADLPFSDCDGSSDVTTEPEIVQTDPPVNQPTESDYTTVPSDRTEATVKDHDSQTFCGHEFAEEQIPGNPQSTCAAWLLDNYHRFKEGWKSCQDVDTSDVLNIRKL